MSNLPLDPTILPPWWSDDIAASWNRSRDAALSDWSVRGDRSGPQDASVVEHALAFGHGARSAYPSCTTWDVICARLEADWRRSGTTGPASWEMVSRIIRHEWLRAAGPGGDAAPDPSAATR